MVFDLAQIKSVVKYRVMNLNLTGKQLQFVNNIKIYINS